MKRDETSVKINQQGSLAITTRQNGSRAFTGPINHDWLIRFNCAQRESRRVMNVRMFNVNGINIRHAKWIRSRGREEYDIRRSATVFRGFQVEHAYICMYMCGIYIRADVHYVSVCTKPPSGHSCVQISSIQKHATRDICACTRSPIRPSRYEFIYTFMKLLRVHAHNSHTYIYIYMCVCVWIMCMDMHVQVYC